MTLAEKIIAGIDAGWSPRLAAAKLKVSEGRLYKLRDENLELKIKMDIYKYRKRGCVDVCTKQAEIEWKHKAKLMAKPNSDLPIGSPIYKRRYGDGSSSV